ncbi:AAA family ATPase, partial [Gemmatimonadota bacterium]
MRLSKLTIFGFKSFADKVEIHIGEGMTAVVGPNGCGKTNIVDALKWVIGEQKPTSIRGKTMEDVIFNGSSTRKPLGFAEVVLTIENTENLLPIDVPEVNITRRLFRSGESEYLINNRQCRLRDIHDLFMDSGIGNNSYTVIQQEMVDVIISDKAEERRAIFEEAAGIQKYKS